MLREVKKTKLDILKIENERTRVLAVRQELKKQRFLILEENIAGKKGYCMECRAIVSMAGVCKARIVNGRVIFIGYCSSCSTQIYKKEK